MGLKRQNVLKEILRMLCSMATVKGKMKEIYGAVEVADHWADSTRAEGKLGCRF